MIYCNRGKCTFPRLKVFCSSLFSRHGKEPSGYGCFTNTLLYIFHKLVYTKCKHRPNSTICLHHHHQTIFKVSLSRIKRELHLLTTQSNMASNFAEGRARLKLQKFKQLEVYQFMNLIKTVPSRIEYQEVFKIRIRY